LSTADAALASTLVAGLELSRDGAAVIEQDDVFGEVRLGPTESRVVTVNPVRDPAAAS
jgi:chromatin segregation and condensation protein Rec8/ScpA/Scc1 (kleisin family)